MKILVFGASGAGTTTLGKEIERLTSFVHLDADDYYWKKTREPYTEKVPLAVRNEKLKADFVRTEDVVVSGSLISWGKEWEIAFDLVVFIYLENELRMERLREREHQRYGEALLADEKRQAHYKAFMDWANQYDNPDFDGRSLKVHNDWIKRLKCRVLRVDGRMELEEKAEKVIVEIDASYEK